MPRSISLRNVLETQSRARSHRAGFSNDIEALKSLWETKGASLQAVADFIPIRVVTLFENAIRGAVEQLVNFGAPFNERGIKILARGSIKDAATLLLAIHTDQVS